ncbi:MAG TPA: prephenate dehydratase [Chloroflexi bacterium]|nr:prephenate dehydratase [Chloroflexota bacterium]HBY06649.1 prephenate dehydratase [Chloroflexota bacterium]
MPEIIVAFQGEPGAYSELAAFEHFGPEIVTLPCESFDHAYEALQQGDCTHALLPFENSLAGSIHRNYDLILRHDLHIVGEHHLRVSHCLLGLPGTSLGNIRRAHSHPQALAQCEHNLARLGIQRVAEKDTAGSARLVKEWNDPQAAAIASTRAAEVYQLEILHENLEDNPHNYTRFLALTKTPLTVADPENGDYKTSVVFSLKNTPGVLFKALSVFALRDIDLTKIESRPIQGQPWEYMFYVDFAGHHQAPNCTRALDHLAELAVYLRVLGSYPRYRWREVG